jgi:hypothetical protein
MPRWWCVFVLVAGSVAVAGCGGGGGGGDPVDASPDQPDAANPGRCEDRDLFALFRASPEQIVAGRYGSQAGGWVNDARAPEIVTPIDSAGACQYIAPQPVLCEPACTGGTVCDVHGACVLFPTTVAAGTVTITGTSPALTMEPQPGNSYYVMMAYPALYGSGDALVLDVEGGGGIDPIHLETVGIPVLTMPTDQFTAREHEDLVIAWDAVAGVPGTEVVIELHNDHHAGPEYIACTTDAALGSVTVPSAILDQLILAGENGIGTYIESAWIELRHRGRVTTSRGCAAFDADADRFISVETIRAP